VAKNIYRVTDQDGTASLELEHEWAREEAEVLPLVRDLSHLEHLTSESKPAFVALAALMFCRGRAFWAVHEGIEAQQRDQLRDRVSTAPRFREAWRNDTGSEPTTDDLLKAADEVSDRIFGGNRQKVTTLERTYDDFNSDLSQNWNVQLIRTTPNAGFTTSDNPLVLANGSSPGSLKHDTVGLQRGVALGDATLLYLPLSRVSGVFFTTEAAGFGQIQPSVVRDLNQLTWENSVEQVVAHPREHISRIAPGATPLGDEWTYG